MPSKTTDAERIAAMEKRHEELMGYISRFEAAFDQLHKAVVRQATTPGQYISPHHDYPIMSMLGSGFPSFHEAGSFRDLTPRDYVSTMSAHGMLGGHRRPEVGFPKGAELAEFLRTHDIGKRLNLSKYIFDGKPSDWSVDRLVGDAVERYLHLYGLDAPIDPRRRHDVLMPLVRDHIAKPYAAPRGPHHHDAFRGRPLPLVRDDLYYAHPEEVAVGAGANGHAGHRCSADGRWRCDACLRLERLAPRS